MNMLARLSTKNKVLLVGAALGVGVLGMAALYTAASLSWAYSEGDRSGTVLKVSKTGWVCKTWEGELAMAMVAGGVPGDQGGISTSTWTFTVRDDALIDKINAAVGKRAVLHYAEHKGVPSTCFGDTPYFVDDIRIIE
jgi:hypothetical protein